MCATRHSANAVTTSGPDKQASWLFDLQDHQLIQLVNSFVAARNMSMSLAQPEEGLHPRGIIKLTTDPGMRIARAVIILLESLEARGPQERLQALRRLHDEVLYSALSSLQKNTARVLIQIMKDLVRAAPHVHIQLPLAHDFYQAVRGTPHVIRSLLRRYHLLEMPEAWNQQAFDHHVHDANTKGRKSPTHLVMPGSRACASSRWSTTIPWTPKPPANCCARPASWASPCASASSSGPPSMTSSSNSPGRRSTSTAAGPSSNCSSARTSRPSSRNTPR